MKRKVTISIIFFAVICVAFFLFILSRGRKDTEIKIKDIYEPLMDYCGDNIETDSKIIALEKSYYNEITGDACCKIVIETKDGQPMRYTMRANREADEVEIFDMGETGVKKYGDEFGFIDFDIWRGGTVDTEYEFVDGKLVIYAVFHTMPLDEDIDIRFYELISSDGGENIYSEGQILKIRNLSEASYVEAELDNAKAYISEMGILIESEMDISNADSIKMIVSDEELVLLENGKCTEDWKIDMNDQWYKFYTMSLFKLEDIKSLVIDGEKYDVGSIKNLSDTE